MESTKDRWLAAAIGLLVLTVYLSTTALRFHSIDEVASFSVTRSFVARGSFDGNILYWTRVPLGRGSIVAQGNDGETYVVKDVLPSLLAAPFVWIGQRTGISPVRFALLLSPLVTSVTVYLLYLFTRRRDNSQTASLIAALTLGFCSLAWPYAETMFTQSTAMLGMLLALFGSIEAHESGRWQWAFVGGAGLGIAGTSAIPLWVTGPLYVLFIVDWANLREDRTYILKLLMAFGIGAGIFLAGQMGYNMVRFDSPLQTGYQQVGASTISPANFGNGFFGLLLSTPRGLLWYVPFVVLIPFGINLGMRTTRQRTVLLALTQFGVVFLLYANYRTWWAGVSWGPRFFVAVMPTLVILCLPLFEKISRQQSLNWPRIAVALVLVVSFLTQLSASTLDYLTTEAPISAALNDNTPPAAWLPTAPILTDISAMPLSRQVQSLRSGRWDTLALSGESPDGMLIVVQVVVLLIGIATIVGLLSEQTNKPIWKYTVLIQTAMCIGLIGLMLARYAQGPDSVAGLEMFTEQVEQQTLQGDAVITVLPNSFLGWIDAYDSRQVDYGFVFETPLTRESETLLDTITKENGRIWLVTEETTGANPENGAEVWLANNAFAGPEQWFEGFRLIPYSVAAPQEIFLTDAILFAQQMTLTGMSYTLQSGWVDVLTRWYAEVTIEQNYTLFVHLISPDGSLAAQNDSQPVSEYRPTSTWKAGENIIDRRSVFLSDGLPAGDYQLLVGWYNPETGERLATATGLGTYSVGTVSIER